LLKITRNPYLNRSMIRSPQAFYGRQREVARLAARIASDPPQSVAVMGDRRIGKSSLLYYISHPDVAAEYLEEPDKTLFLFMDFQEERRLDVEGFCNSVYRHVEEILDDRYVISAESDYQGLQKVVEELNRDGYKLILILDEFDRVTRSSTFDTDFFAGLRSLAGHYNIAYITSSSRDLQQLCHTQEIADSPFFNIFSTLQLGSIQPAEALQLIVDPSAATPFPLEQHADLILDLGGRLPFFLQMACSATFEILLEDGELQQARVHERFLEEAQPHFQFYWEQMDPVSRALCNDMACGRSPDGTRGEYQDLVKRGFILEEGRLFSSLFAAFLRQAYAREVGEEPVEVQAERLRSMEGELDKAREMQMGLLPQENPQGAGLDVAGRCVPASQVGGDFYKYIWLDETQTKLGIVAVDVMGHGMEGAVTAMRFSETLRYEARGRSRPGDILEGLNRALYGTLRKREYVTCCIGVIDLEAWLLEVSIGGHHPPLHYSRDQDRVSEADLGNLPLGLNPDQEYKSAEVKLGEGDVLLFYSDGVIEAQDDREVLYGEDRLQELLLQAGRDGLGAEALIEQLYWDVNRFQASVGQLDDITAIAVRMTEK
jgi:serine phosphatase RsbU (regulator of sigma subunit)